MVSWSADGTVAGYDPVLKRLKKGMYHFATPGTVDVGAKTRLNTPMGAGLSTTNYPNKLMPQAPLTFSAADFNANGGKHMGCCVMLVRADNFPAGYVPTPKEIFNAPMDRVDWAQRATKYVSGPAGSPAFSQTFEFDIPNPDGYFWNTKWWMLLYPANHVDSNAVWSKTNDPPLKGTDINVAGRAISFWSNRTPGKPIITSPVDGALVLPGAEFTLRLDPKDPDEVAPEDAAKYNDDVNGVDFQYRPAPTAQEPNPEWIGLPFDWSYVVNSSVPFVNKRRDEAWHIRGSRYWNGLAATPFHEALVANLGCSVVAGAGDGFGDFKPGKGALPVGDWQIRGRTFDYGHPYPNSGTQPDEPGPLGINPATNWLIEPAKDTYLAANTSPWSDPVSVSIPAQVPAPVIVSPRDATAVSRNALQNTVRLQWRYRNTHQPPRLQFTREVQIRKVGDPNWATVFAGANGDDYVDLPYSISQDSIPPMELLPNGSFEANNTDGWGPFNGDPVPRITRINDAGKAHSGSGYLEMTTSLTDPGDPNAATVNVFQAFVPPAEYLKFTFDGWVWIPPEQKGYLLVQFVWADANGGFLNAPIEMIDGEAIQDADWPYQSLFFTAPGQADAGGWFHISEMTPVNSNFDRLTVFRPPTGVTLNALVAPNADGLAGSVPVLGKWRGDEWSLRAEGTGLDSFTLKEGNQYEWRVRVSDTDAIESGYSTPARFWVVPGAGTGNFRPVPGETIDGATLGTGTHTVEVFKRGGKVRVDELKNISYLDWERKRDDISTARVVISGWDENQGALLKKLQTWAYEIVITRNNGYTRERVWEGPISLITYKSDEVSIDARDVMNYAYRRIIKQRMSDSGKGNGRTVVDRAQRVIQNVFAPDDPNILSYLQIMTRDDDAMQYRSTPAYSRTAFEEVDDMAANSGLDYTVVGRAILLWGTKHRIGTLPELRDSDLGASPIVSEYGMSMANVYSVSDGNGTHGEAVRTVSGNDPVYGLVEMLSSTWASDSESDSGTYTQEGLETVKKSFVEFAERSIADRYPPPVVVRVPDNTTLNPTAPVSIQHLVPGVVIPLRSTSTLRTVRDNQKLDAVKVVETKGNETISITMSPFTRDDAAVVEGAEE